MKISLCAGPLSLALLLGIGSAAAQKDATQPGSSFGAAFKRASAAYDRTVNSDAFRAARKRGDFIAIKRLFEANGLDYLPGSAGDPQEQAVCRPPWYLQQGMWWDNNTHQYHLIWMCVKNGQINKGIPTGQPHF